ncbi:hypothetical protein O0L34_g13503 [Tuta absoluta]|nr:hypothetical protein O0L34_g13503 [Tuta absoluta]
MECSTGCGREINNVSTEALKCKHCSKLYHWKCLHIKEELFSNLSSEFLGAWTCPACCVNVNNNRLQSRQNPQQQSPTLEDIHDMSLDNSVVETTLPLSSGPSNRHEVVTMDKISALFDQKIRTSLSTVIDEKIQRGLSSFRAELQDDIKKMVAAEVMAEVKPVVDKMEKDFTQTTDFICDEQKQLQDQINEKSSTIIKLQYENIKVTIDLQKLQGRLSSIENMSRSYNVELQSVSETKTENLIMLLKNLCSTIGATLSETDVIACRRVAKIDPSLKRPRNILITLSSPRLRDSIISLASRFNKGKVNENKLDTSHLGLPGSKSRIYVTEHISPECKQLFNEAKKIKIAKN